MAGLFIGRPIMVTIRKFLTHSSSKFINIATFSWPLQGEFSTIDTSIMIAGGIFAGNYFGREVEIYADIIKSIPKWGTTICDESQEKDCSGIFMISDENHESSNENGMRGQTKPFNEYMLNSFLAMAFEKQGDNAYWFYNDAFGFNGEPVGRFFTQNNGNVVRKPAQLDYQTENGIKYRIGYA